jgi:hypothetical protein
MTDAGSAGEDLDQDGERANDPPVRSWQPPPERGIRRSWLFAAFGVVVVAIGVVVVKLATGSSAVPRVDPGALAAPVTLPPSVRAPKPPPQPTESAQSAQSGQPAGTEAVADGDVCPGSDGVSADDQPGWQHATVENSAAACGGRYSLHTTSQAGGVFYRWTTDVSQAGHCDITVYVPDTDQANVARVHYSVLDGDTLVEGFVIAQAKDHGQFVSAGSYPASGNAPLVVQMDNRSPVAGTVVASAVRFSCQPG